MNEISKFQRAFMFLVLIANGLLYVISCSDAFNAAFSNYILNMEWENYSSGIMNIIGSCYFLLGWMLILFGVEKLIYLPFMRCPATK